MIVVLFWRGYEVHSLMMMTMRMTMRMSLLRLRVIFPENMEICTSHVKHVK